MSTWVIATISLFRDIGSGAVQTGPGRAIMGLLPLHAEADKIRVDAGPRATSSGAADSAGDEPP